MPLQSVPQLIVLTDPALSSPTPGGVYLLRIQLIEPLSVVFGRFRKGVVIPLSAGEYLYVGSALGGLGRRLLRHATRSDGSAHPVRQRWSTISASPRPRPNGCAGMWTICWISPKPP